jgi:nicotinate-nucleotide adenylyltransferase
MTIGVLGGTFDPPHWAHVGAARYVLSEALVSRVFVVPVFSHAFAKQPLAPFESRVHMCELAFAGISGVEVLGIERELPSPSYTITTVRALRERFPAETFRLLVGTDVVSDLPRWHESAELLSLAPPLVLERRGYPFPGSLPAALPEVSSTELRQELARLHQHPDRADLRSRLSQLVPEVVLEWIRKQGLYRDQSAL